MLGSALGGVARFWLAGTVERRTSGAFPWGILAVNASGALTIGIVAGIATGTEGGLGGAELRQFLVFGFLGSYTTVSSFSLQTLALLQAGRPARALANVALSVALCLGGAALGALGARAIAGGS